MATPSFGEQHPRVSVYRAGEVFSLLAAANCIADSSPNPQISMNSRVAQLSQDSFVKSGAPNTRTAGTVSSFASIALMRAGSSFKRDATVFRIRKICLGPDAWTGQLGVGILVGTVLQTR
jgi:hypothetical protein